MEMSRLCRRLPGVKWAFVWIETQLNFLVIAVHVMFAAAITLAWQRYGKLCFDTCGMTSFPFKMHNLHSLLYNSKMSFHCPNVHHFNLEHKLNCFDSCEISQFECIGLFGQVDFQLWEKNILPDMGVYLSHNSVPVTTASSQLQYCRQLQQ